MVAKEGSRLRDWNGNEVVVCLISFLGVAVEQCGVPGPVQRVKKLEDSSASVLMAREPMVSSRVVARIVVASLCQNQSFALSNRSKLSLTVRIHPYSKTIHSPARCALS
jgi:hypothetical protein